eukprot:CAMPEP_0118930578 /NCGR_PEP_ID=MMETSP1169-20130426/7214_1 /TAXON_ID=36882 /ORGANISM="Pyramimonas obovata, Strain CCMP722" /LENGTH=306 /DNA_ID=CAMNT_0006872955 /DNA_START=409 /DNA_END=1327 /DNA_ORIENTATION=+
MAYMVRRSISSKEKFNSLSDEDKRRVMAAARMRAQSQASASSSNAAYYLFALVIGMVGLTYASVPLYRMFCQATGYGGTTRRVKSVEEKLLDAEEMDEASASIVANRQLKITFNSDVSDGMQWKFSPCQREVRCVPGQTVLAFFRAQNLSDAAITGVSTYNVTPMKAGPYFNKIQCFCFEEQRLQAGEEVDMPVFFYVDPEFALDPKMKGVDTLTLSYTFFKVDEEKGDLIGQATAQAAAANIPTIQDEDEYVPTKPVGLNIIPTAGALAFPTGCACAAKVGVEVRDEPSVIRYTQGCKGLKSAVE